MVEMLFVVAAAAAEVVDTIEIGVGVGVVYIRWGTIHWIQHIVQISIRRQVVRCCLLAGGMGMCAGGLDVHYYFLVARRHGREH